MAFETYRQKDSIAVVYTGNSKGKTSASLGLMCRALGRGWRVAYIQFIKNWEVGEHTFIQSIQPVFNGRLLFYKGGRGFFDAGELSARDVSEAEHKRAAEATLAKALECATNGNYDLVICDEINNAVHDGLLETSALSQLLEKRLPHVSLCLTGRHFPEDLLGYVDIATNMQKIKHHFDDQFLAKEGIDY